MESAWRAVVPRKGHQFGLEWSEVDRRRSLSFCTLLPLDEPRAIHRDMCSHVFEISAFVAEPVRDIGGECSVAEDPHDIARLRRKHLWLS